MKNCVQVDLGERSYDIMIGRDVLAALGETADRTLKGAKILLVTDANVAPLYIEKCEKLLQESGRKVARAVIPAGEPSKSEKCLFELYDACLAHEMDRSSAIVALGGGVVGDLAGYLAASFLRGIEFLQVPTSLLAMVDSSVGGKTGINLPSGKNLVGAFYQPQAVCIDLNTLKTLPRREYLSGLAEVVKYGVIYDEDLFVRLEGLGEALTDCSCPELGDIVARCCEIKAEVVHLDEREGGLRAILNFGHTLGHAIENAQGYGELLHGEAVSIGMAFAAQLSVLEADFPEAHRDRLIGLLKAIRLPVSMEVQLDWADLKKAMAVDKKSVAGVPRFVLADTLGQVKPGWQPSEATLQDAFAWLSEQT